jgi:hypothetical protein
VKDSQPFAQHIHAQENGNAVYIEWVRNGGAFMGRKISMQLHLKKEKRLLLFLLYFRNREGIII